MNEFMKLFFQPPVLILFALAAAGLFDIIQRRSDHRFRVDLEWRVRESFYRRHAKLNDALIARSRKRFYARHFLKEPKGPKIKK